MTYGVFDFPAIRAQMKGDDKPVPACVDAEREDFAECSACSGSGRVKVAGLSFTCTYCCNGFVSATP